MSTPVTSPYYYMRETVGFLRDKPLNTDEFYDLDFHIKSGDYFNTVAGLLGFILEDYEENISPESEQHKLLLQKIRGDLASLNNTYDIVPKQHSTQENLKRR